MMVMSSWPPIPMAIPTTSIGRNPRRRSLARCLVPRIRLAMSGPAKKPTQMPTSPEAMYQTGGADMFSMAVRRDPLPVTPATIAMTMRATTWPTTKPTPASTSQTPASFLFAGTGVRGELWAWSTDWPVGPAGGPGLGLGLGRTFGTGFADLAGDLAGDRAGDPGAGFDAGFCADPGTSSLPEGAIKPRYCRGLVLFGRWSGIWWAPSDRSPSSGSFGPMDEIESPPTPRYQIAEPGA